MNRLYIVSSGAGGTKYLTTQAIDAINDSEVVVSYTKYAKDLKNILKNKELYTSGMTHEIDRCNQAIKYALKGKTTSIISNGDVNVFAMATLIVELIDEKDLWNKIEVISIPGVTSFLAAASRMGAPISQDFAVISLSDRLTDINMIDKRVNATLQTDFIIGIYNPKSRTRIVPYQNFLKSLKQVENRIIIIASNVGRDKEQITISNSEELIALDIDNPLVSMSTLLIVCNSNSYLTKNGKVLTPRGYLNKYDMAGDLKNAD